MDRTRIKALQKQVKEWKRYSEPPAKISRMVADQVGGWLSEYRAKNAEYLTKQLANVKTLRDVMAAKSSFIDDTIVSKNSLKYAALPTARLKTETPKNYTDALVLAKELRARGADKEADKAATRADLFSQEFLYDRGFQEILGDALTREAVFLAPGMIPTIPIEQITNSNVQQRQVAFMPIEDIIKEISDGDAHLQKMVSGMVDADAGRSHLPENLKMEYYEIGKLRVTMEPTLEDMTAGWDPERKADFMANLPESVLEKYKAPDPIDMSRINPADKSNTEHEAAITDIARGIIADERAALGKDIAAMKGTGGST